MKSRRLRKTWLVILAIGVAQVPEKSLSVEFGMQTLEVLKRLDENRDRRLSEKEFVGERGGAARARARKRFRRLDVDGDKWLSVSELKNM